MPILTIKIVDRGTLEVDGKSSVPGHMWYTVTDDSGHTDSYGFSPVEEGNFNGLGTVNRRGMDDNQRYIFDDSESGGDYSRTIEITQQHYNVLKDFGENYTLYGFDKNYNALNNSCIDFVWKALELSSLNPTGFQGDSWPTNNIDNIKKINPANPSAANFTKSPDSDNLVLGAIKSHLNSLISNSHTISTHFQSLFNSLSTAEATEPRRYDPLTLDLDGDGIDLIALKDSKAFFDLDITEVLDSSGKGTGTYISDGVKEQVGWIKADDALLTLDKNNNGSIDNILELFGKQNKTGTEELREFDLNNSAGANGIADGKINSSDAIFSKLKLWQDFNGDGISQADELKSLTSF